MRTSLTNCAVQLSGWSVFLKGKWDTATFVTNYLPLVTFPILYTGAKFFYRDTIKKPHEMDFVTNIKEIEEETYVWFLTCVYAVVNGPVIQYRYDDPPPKNRLEAFWAWLVSNLQRATFRITDWCCPDVNQRIVASCSCLILTNYVTFVNDHWRLNDNESSRRPTDSLCKCYTH